MTQQYVATHRHAILQVKKKKTWQILNRATIIYVFTEIQGQPISRKHDISTKVCW